MLMSGLHLELALSPEPIIEVRTALLVITSGLCLFLMKALATARRELRQVQAAARRQAQAALAASTAAAGVPPELVAVITAAVCVTLDGAPHRITRIAAPTPLPAWSLEGRREVFGSHRVR